LDELSAVLKNDNSELQKHIHFEFFEKKKKQNFIMKFIICFTKKYWCLKKFRASFTQFLKQKLFTIFRL